MPSRSRRTLVSAHFLFTPHDSAIVRREQHHSRPRESRSPNASSATLPPDDDRVSVFPFTVGCQTACARRVDANRPACERCRRGDRVAPSVGTRVVPIRYARAPCHLHSGSCDRSCRPDRLPPRSRDGASRCAHR